MSPGPVPLRVLDRTRKRTGEEVDAQIALSEGAPKKTERAQRATVLAHLCAHISFCSNDLCLGR